MMFIPFGETNDLVLDRRTVTRASPLYPAAIEGGTFKIIPDQAVRLFGRIGHIAAYLVSQLYITVERETLRWFVTRLLDEPGIVHRPEIDTGGCSGFEPAEIQAEPLKRAGEIEGCRFSRPATGI